jgi:hypothetical protein
MAQSDDAWLLQLFEALKKMCALTQALKNLKDEYNAELTTMRIGSPEEVKRTERFLKDWKVKERELRRPWRKVDELLSEFGMFLNSPFLDSP